MAITMLRRRRGIAALVALVSAVALGLLLAMALSAGGPGPAHAAVRHTPHHAGAAHDADNVQIGDQTSPDPAPGAARSGVSDPAGNSQAGGPDTSGASDPAGNSQASGPDTSGANDPAGNSQAGGPDTSSPSNESSGDSEQGQAGEPAGGHADPTGPAGSDCGGSCVQ